MARAKFHSTGKIERVKVKVGDTVELVGCKGTRTTTVTGVETSNKIVHYYCPLPLPYFQSRVKNKTF